MTAVIVLAILAVGASWLLWGHLKQIQIEDLNRDRVRCAKHRPDEPHDDDLEK